MAIISNMMREEKDRLDRMKKVYMEKISQLPKGCITYKTRGNRKYAYLKYREGKKVRTDYLKLNEKELKDLEFKIKQRRKYIKLIKDIKKDLRILGKVIKK